MYQLQRHGEIWEAAACKPIRVNIWFLIIFRLFFRFGFTLSLPFSVEVLQFIFRLSQRQFQESQPSAPQEKSNIISKERADTTVAA